MARHAFALLKQGLVVFWSRKAGNTSLAEWVYEVAIKEKHRRHLNGIPPRRFLTIGQYVVDHLVALDLITKMGYEDFVLARDPYARVVSAYVNKFVVDRDRTYTSFEDLEPFAQRAVREMSECFPGRIATGDGYRGFSFEEFLEYILMQVQKRGGGEPMLNPHWNTQVPFYYSDRLDYNTVIRLENVETEITPLAEKFRTNIAFPTLRTASSSANDERDQDLSQVRSVDLAKTNTLPTARALLSPKSKEIIRTAYEIDFRKLRYAT